MAYLLVQQLFMGGIFKRNSKQEAFLAIDDRIHATVSHIEGRVSCVVQNPPYQNAIPQP